MKQTLGWLELRVVDALTKTSDAHFRSIAVVARAELLDRSSQCMRDNRWREHVIAKDLAHAIDLVPWGHYDE